MKKNFPPLKQIRTGARSRAGIWIIIIAALLLALTRLNGLKTGALNLGAGILKLGEGITTFSDFLQELLTRKIFLVEELDTLRSSKLELEAKNSRLEAKITELWKIENLLNENKNPGKLALILSSGINSPYDTLWSNLGSDHGIKNGNKAIAYGSVVLGTVETASGQNSTIKLFSYPGLVTEGFLESKSLNIALEGLGGSNLKFYVPKNIGIKVGDRVLYNSTPSYLIGQVEYIKERPSEPLAEVVVRPPLNIRELRYLELKP
ncbi:MAG: rod shape-determining protein MreC [bacterium]|nr:rod shape-determining protein MreC [bacterium]